MIVEDVLGVIGEQYDGLQVVGESLAHLPVDFLALLHSFEQAVSILHDVSLLFVSVVAEGCPEIQVL